MKIRQNSSEYFFEYNIEVSKNELNIPENFFPKLYLEKDLKSENVGYTIFAVLPFWLEPKENILAQNLLYDTVRIIFDVGGQDCLSLDKLAMDSKTNKIEFDNTYYLDQEYTTENNKKTKSYRDLKYRINLVHDQNDYSGTGQIIVTSKDKSKVTIFYFAVNFVFKKIINYSILKKGNKYTFKFHTENPENNVIVKALTHKDRLPCLLEDTNFNNVFSEFSVEFNGKKDYEITLTDKTENKNLKMFLTFASKSKAVNYEDFYLLECVENQTIGRIKKDILRPKLKKLCPYCHNPIEVNADNFKKGYNNGGVSCQGHYLMADFANTHQLRNNRNTIAKKVIYCEDDCIKTDKGLTGFNGNYSRILPEKYLESKDFKIAILGSGRAGKSTFISRLFNITGGSFDVRMDMQFVKNVTKNLCTIENYNIKTVNNYLIEDKHWQAKQDSLYGNLSMSVGDYKLYPKPTDKNNEENVRHPFIMKVNGNNYISFYDIAGEEAEKKESNMSKVINGTSGVFLLINVTNENKNKLVAQNMKDYLEFISKSCPIAVLVTKFDKIESAFNPNCHCLRSDTFEQIARRYENSQIERNIDFASEEIKAYLLDKQLSIDNYLTGFDNVKYFAVSSFAFEDSIYHVDARNTLEEENFLNFECSPKRLELPLIWMMKQLGIIV